MTAVKLYCIGSIAHAWLEECFSRFIHILSTGQNGIQRAKEFPGQGKFCLPENLVDRYAKMSVGQIPDMRHLQGACSCIARKHGFASAQLQFDDHKEYIDLIVQA